ncbi:MAG: glycosyltransferase family protein [Thermoguttaceae bacterium]|jgi:spore coat polysaccharide biosynthesis protein SpsF
MNIVAIVQARMGSTRLPGKTLLDICGEPMLARVLARCERAETLSGVVVATTTEPADDVLCDLCMARDWLYYRGSQVDVLDRYYQAARLNRAEIVVRITSDCPVIDPDVIDLTVSEFLRLQPDCDYVSNGEPPRPYPRGQDVEVFHFRALERAWHEACKSAFREHVTPYIYRHPEKFRVAAVQADRDYSDQRWTVDTVEDRALVLKLFEHFGHDRFGWRDILTVLAEHPEWLEINRHVQQKTT